MTSAEIIAEQLVILAQQKNLKAMYYILKEVDCRDEPDARSEDAIEDEKAHRDGQWVRDEIERLAKARAEYSQGSSSDQADSTPPGTPNKPKEKP